MREHSYCLALICAVLSSQLAAVSAQDGDYTSQEVAVAKLCAHEGTWRTSDCAAIAYARGHLPESRLRTMHRRALGPTPSRAWIAGLTGDGSEPAGWPSHLDWSDYRGRWMALLATVRGVARGTEAPPCSERPSVWGSRTLDADRLARILANGGREVCRGTANAFVVFGRGRR